MCWQMRSHFHNWNEHDGVCIFNRVTRMGSQIFKILEVTNILVNRDFKMGRLAIEQATEINRNHKNCICPKLTEKESLIGHRIDL